MLKKLRLKFVCIVMAVVSVMLLVMFSLVIGFTNRTMEQANQAALHRAVMEPGFRNDPMDERGILPYFVVSRDMLGRLRVSGTIALENYGEETILEVYEIAGKAEDQTGELKEYDLLYLKEGNKIVFLDVTSQRMALRTMTAVCLGVGGVSFLLMLLLSILLATWAVKPVEQAWNQQRQFVADASHELKTPLTVIMTNAELLQEAENDLQRQQSADSILLMSRQMRSLAEGLLELARVDNGAVMRDGVALNVSELVEDAILPFEPLFFEKGLRLSTRIAAGISVQGSEAYLRQLVGILLDNAMKYSDPEGVVYVVLTRKGNNALLSVANPSQPIPEAELEQIFKRFYRVDKARSRDGSFGLGLSIADGIVREHGGRIWAENDEGWVVLRAQLPLIQ